MRILGGEPLRLAVALSAAIVLAQAAPSLADLYSLDTTSMSAEFTIDDRSDTSAVDTFSSDSDVATDLSDSYSGSDYFDATTSESNVSTMNIGSLGNDGSTSNVVAGLGDYSIDRTSDGKLRSSGPGVTPTMTTRGVSAQPLIRTTPVPAAAWLGLMGLAGVALARRRLR